MEIGSIYEIDPSLLQSRGEKGKQPPVLGEIEKYHKKYTRYTASGREAIALALKNMEMKEPDIAKRCLLPAYMCDTVFFPFARAGWEMHFYHLDRKLRAQIEELRGLTEQVKPGLIFVHSYYGVDTWKSARPLFAVWKEQGIRIMEDVTQSYYLEEAGLEADYCVGSLRKWYAVPDGGFVASDEELPDEKPAPGGEFGKKRRELLTEKWEYLYGKKDIGEKQALKADYLKKNRETEDWLDDYAGISGISEESSYLLSHTDENVCKNKRRTNCAYLHEKMAGMTQVVPVFDSEFGQACGAGRDHRERGSAKKAAPLYYPVYARERDGLQKFLSSHDVYAPTLWPIGRENAAFLSEEEKYIYEHILALPVDQRYGVKEMQRIVEVLDQYEKQFVPRRADGEQENRHKIGIRVDANETVATGHVMRCITIAKQLLLAGEKVLFFTADEYAGELLRQAGMGSVCLHTQWNRMEEETGILRARLQETGCGKLLVDSYQASAKYFEGLRDICKLIYIDDGFEDVYPVDMLVNYNAYHVRFPYQEAYAGKAKLLLGTAYVPLREEFGRSEKGSCHALEKVVYGEKILETVANTHVLLSSGGGDLCNALPGILSEAMEDETLRQVIFHTVVGGFHRNAEELESIAAQWPNIRLHYHVDHMARLMGECTAAVSAAGTMLFELSAMQIPTVFFVSADNQQYDSEFFAQEERMLFAGDIRQNRRGCLRKICGQLKVILKDRNMRERMKKKLHEVTDGKGAGRIAEEIACL